MTFADTIKKADVPEAPDERRYDGLPVIRWNNGQQSKHPSVPDAPGEFYISEKTLGKVVPKGPWTEVTRFKNEVGYACGEIDFIFIATKSQPYRDIRNTKGDFQRREWQATWQEGVSKSVMTEYLVYADGFYDPAEPQYGSPVILQAKGMVGKRINQLLTRYREELLAEGMRIANEGKAPKSEKVKLPMWSFRLHLGPERDGKKFAFTETGYGSVVQLPDLYLPKDISDEVLNDLYVGDTMLQHGRVVYDSYEEWRKTLHSTGDAQEEDGTPSAKPAAASQEDARSNRAGAGGREQLAPERETVPQRAVFARDRSGQVIDLAAELERVTPDELGHAKSTFKGRREEALRKLEWDTETREQYEGQIFGKPFVFSKLSDKEQYQVVLQLEQYAREGDVPF